jgi:glutamate carboxypeptidase
MAEDLRQLVLLESPSDDPGRVSELARWVVERLRRAGARARTLAAPPAGDAVFADVGRAPAAALLVGHLDTVWPAGSLAEAPFEMREGRALGPGVFDMKGGIAVAIHLFEELSVLTGGPGAALCLTPDEEVGTGASRRLLLEEAARHRYALILEPSLEGAAKIARKGTGTFQVSFKGLAAHAGLEPEKGASALAELARFVISLGGLGDLAAGTTVTPTVARAGTRTNVVPEEAEVSVDVRAWTGAEADRVSDAITSYVPEDSRITIEVEGGMDRPPMEPTEKSLALYEKARAVASRLGFELGAARVGGGSDGNLTASAGVPTLDGLGPKGAGAHARNEFLDLGDLPRRAALLASLLSELE